MHALLPLEIRAIGPSGCVYSSTEYDGCFLTKFRKIQLYFLILHTEY